MFGSRQLFPRALGWACLLCVAILAFGSLIDAGEDGLIFRDDFESGSVGAWSEAVGLADPVESQEIHGFVFTAVADGSEKYLPEVTVYARDLATGNETDRRSTDCRGRFVLPQIPPADYEICLEAPGFISSCSGPVTVDNLTVFPQAYELVPTVAVAEVLYGAVALADGSPARFTDVTFGIDQQASVQLIDTGTQQVVTEVPVGCHQQFVISGFEADSHYVLRARYAGTSVDVPATFDGTPSEMVLANRRPVIESLYAAVGGVATFQPAAGSTVRVMLESRDADADSLTVRLQTDHGILVPLRGAPSGAEADWTLDSRLVRQNLWALVGDDFGGYARQRLDLITDQGIRFGGQVLDSEGQPIVGAEVTLDGEGGVTDEQGMFEILRFNESPRYLLNIRKSGYPLLSRVLLRPENGRIYRLQAAQRFVADPKGSILVLEEGVKNPARLTIPAGALVYEDGTPATEPVNVYLRTRDLSDVDNGMPGDYMGLDEDGNEVALTSFGVISITVEDSAGNELNLAPGQGAQIAIPIPESKQGLSLPTTIPIWIYDQARGLWERASEGSRFENYYVAVVDHFSEINADIELVNWACVRVLVDTSVLALPFDLRIEVPSTGDVLTHTVSDPVNVIYALPPSTPIELVVLDASGVPIETSRQMLNTGAFNPGCACPPAYPYSCCTAQTTMTLDVKPSSGFLEFIGTATEAEALWYYSVIDPVAATGAGTISSSGTAVTGVGTSFTGFFTVGDLLQPAPTSGAGTVSNTAGSNTVSLDSGTFPAGFFLAGDILRAAGQTRVVMVPGTTSVTTNSSFDPPLSSASYERLELRRVSLVPNALSLQVDTAFNHAPTGATYEKVGTKPTLADWNAANGLAGPPDAEAVYYNAPDLGFGRWMSYKVTGADVAYSVANYGIPGIADPNEVTSARLAAMGITDLRFATVTMEYSDHPILSGGRYTKFYVYNNVGERIIAADLDGVVRYLPHLCLDCHGGEPDSFDSRGDAGAHFLPFDLPALRYSGHPLYTRSAQEPQFKMLNSGILLTSPPPALQEMIEESYGGPSLPGATFDDTFVPSAWTGSASQIDLYNKVVKVSCRGCHITRDAPIDWAAFDPAGPPLGFKDYGGLSKYLTCTALAMPNAKVTYDNFWTSNPEFQPNILANSGLLGWLPTDDCPDC